MIFVVLKLIKDDTYTLPRSKFKPVSSMSHHPRMSVFALEWLLLAMAVAMFGITECGRSDIECLISIKQSLQDPNGMLSSWIFTNSSQTTSICPFVGVECWHEGDNKVMVLRLRGLGLRGEFPRGIAACNSLTALDLSQNHLYGPIPSNLSKLLGFVTALDLSDNTLSGEIPADIANCSYLNVLNLSNNELTGRIPPQLALLPRLRSFTVANNDLSGPVPLFVNTPFASDTYADNAGLCGHPLPRCTPRKPNFTAILFCIGWFISFTVFLAIGICAPFWEYLINLIKIKVWQTPSRGQNSMISRMEKFATRMSFLELKQATDDFNQDNVIAAGEMGVTYKVILSNGYCLAIKRLGSAPHAEHEFLTEIVTLGRLRHRNLVPLFGFCHEQNERFLVYKFMPKGTLHDFLFWSEGTTMGWPIRAQIAIGIARGISWLHLNKVVHRRISSECVLLDEDLNPRISDLGRATTLNCNDSRWEVSRNRELMQLNCYEEDVHGFGKVLLELMTGTMYGEIILSFDIDGDMFEQISGLLKRPGPAGGCVRKMMGLGFDDEIYLFLRVAGKCLECDPLSWPSMEEVYKMLTGKRGYEAVDSEVELDMIC